MKESLRVVELGLATVRAVDTDVLGADEVLAIRSALRDGEFDPVLVPGAPSSAQEVGAGVADGLLKDLEPFTVTLVLVGSTGGLGHVDKSRSRVLHGSTNAELHGHLGSSLDLSGSGAASALERALVAAEVVHVRGHVVAGVLPLGGVVLGTTSVLADVLERLRLLAVDDEDIEKVVSGGKLRNGGTGKKRELHVELRLVFVFELDEETIVVVGLACRNECSSEGLKSDEKRKTDAKMC